VKSVLSSASGSVPPNCFAGCQKSPSDRTENRRHLSSTLRCLDRCIDRFGGTCRPGEDSFCFGFHLTARPFLSATKSTTFADLNQRRGPPQWVGGRSSSGKTRARQSLSSGLFQNAASASVRSVIVLVETQDISSPQLPYLTHTQIPKEESKKGRTKYIGIPVERVHAQPWARSRPPGQCNPWRSSAVALKGNQPQRLKLH